MDSKINNADAVKAWLTVNPAVLDKWLSGVKTTDDRDALTAVKATL